MHWVTVPDMCLIPTITQSTGELTPPPPYPGAKMTLLAADSETMKLNYAFLNLSQHCETKLAPFYRWFVLHSIHKRSFKNNAFIRDIPNIPSGPGAWKIERILLTICDSTHITDKERKILCNFLEEYRQQIEYNDGDQASSIGPENVATWGPVKRMFDMNDSKHIAGALGQLTDDYYNQACEASSLHRDDRTGEASSVRHDDLIYSTPSPRRIGEEYQWASKLEKSWLHKSHEMHKYAQRKVNVEERGRKRVVSASAARSSSPTKKNKVDIENVDITDYDSAVEMEC